MGSVDEFDNVLERMRGARERWSTVRATLLKWHDLALGEEALDRFIAQEPPGSVVRSEPKHERLLAGPLFFETELRVWGRKPYRWRIETEERQGRLR